jgi:hypothetical protein
MGYYYTAAGDKITVDDHSSETDRALAHYQQQIDGQAQSKSLDQAAAQTAAAAAAKKAAEDKANADAAAIGQIKKDAYNSHFQYGGTATGAAQAAGMYGSMGQNAQQREGVQVDYGRANSANNQAEQSRAQQLGIAGIMAARARGEVPSIASMQADRQMHQAAAEQTSAAASARGPAALALAQQGAAANTAGAQANISSMAQINGAQERLQAEQAAMGAYSGMRGQDYQNQSQAAQQAQYQAGLSAEQRKQNDQFQLGAMGLQNDVNKAQLGAQGNQASIEANASQAKAQAAQAQAALAQNQSQYDSSRWDKYLIAGGGAAATAGGVLLLNALGGNAGNAGGGNTTVGEFGASPNYGVPLAGDTSTSSSDTGSYYGGNDGSSAGASSNPWQDGVNSDVRLKQGIENEGQHPLMNGNSRVDAFLDGIHPLSYHYKQESSEPRSQPTGGRYLGISAQDLEAVPEVGHQLVSEGPRGKQVEIGPSLSAALAGLARLHERVKELEGDAHDGAPHHGAPERGAPQHGHITSDMRAKGDVVSEGSAPYVDPRRAAWEEGHAAAVADVGTLAKKTPEQLRAYGDHPLAAAVRDAKRGAYNEGGRGQLADDQRMRFAAAGASMDAAAVGHADRMAEARARLAAPPSTIDRMMSAPGRAYEYLASAKPTAPERGIAHALGYELADERSPAAFTRGDPEDISRPKGIASVYGGP